MGLLKVGTPLEWGSCVQHSRYIREHGIKQFLATWRRVKDIANDRLYYGDEIEYAVLKVDGEKREVRLSLRGIEIMKVLNSREEANQPHIRGCTWHQEYGSWMLEGTPAAPYGGYTSSLVQVEQNMRLRRARLLAALAPDEIAPTVVNFPLMGVGDFVHPPAPAGGPASQSSCVPDACINPHPRFGTLTANIRARRGSKVDIRMPLFVEDAGSVPNGEGAARPEKRQRTTPESDGTPVIEMDCMAFGMGCCCLQVTFQASDIEESRYLYDQLATLAPIMLALTAATPIFKGHLSGVDVRWDAIAASVDDRTPAERGSGEKVPADPHMVGGGIQPMSKSRYDSISCYIQQSAPAPEYYNDVPCEIDEDTKRTLMNEGIDAALAHHLAHLFVRDPLVAFAGNVEEVNDQESVDHFESINSTNWQTVRWKPPPPKVMCGPHVGWRTEFRSMEVQLTDFENAAFTAFIVLITRTLLVFDLDLLVPLSKVDDNMRRAHAMDAVNSGKFWFRKHVIPQKVCQRNPRPATTLSDSYEEMSMNEVINGKSSYFPGLVPLCFAYLEHIGCDSVSYGHLRTYLNFISQRASGELLTPAAWMRRFVREHPEYKNDSVVTQGIAFDLMHACDQIGRGQRSCPELHGDAYIEPIKEEGTYDIPLKSSNDPEAIQKLLRQIEARAGPDDGPGSMPMCPMRSRANSTDQ
mmetsp:Transcript_107661/g.314782  ORF Transcript_107661/g.314782 Transcript_107661/m.314782 type:complete len:694 (-) Transcript_107661:70-2151(-)